MFRRIEIFESESRKEFLRKFDDFLPFAFKQSYPDFQSFCQGFGKAVTGCGELGFYLQKGGTKAYIIEYLFVYGFDGLTFEFLAYVYL